MPSPTIPFAWQGCNKNDLLRVLCAFKTSTRRTRSVSVISVFGLSLPTENTEKTQNAPQRKTTTNRLRKNPGGLSFRGAAGDEESRIALRTLRARFLAPLGMTAWGVFPQPANSPHPDHAFPSEWFRGRQVARRGALAFRAQVRGFLPGRRCACRKAMPRRV